LYIDDLVVIGCSVEHHMRNLESVFKRLRAKNLKLNPKKCLFLQSSVTYLGHHISGEGIKPDQSKFEVIKNYPKPTNADEVRRFVAFCNYYRRFVENFALIANPLNKLLKKNATFIWSKECDLAFEKLKNNLMNPPILQYPNFENEFILTTDASDIACGAVLSQEINNKNLPVAFASKSFTKGEKNKSTIEKELTAIHWAVNYFKPYLFGKKFKILTDHKPLVYLFTMKNPTSKLTRMRWDLEEFDYEVGYITGKTNFVADALSRIEVNSEMLKNINIYKMQTRSMSRKEITENDKSSEESESESDQLKVYEALSANEIRKMVELRVHVDAEKWMRAREIIWGFAKNKKIMSINMNLKDLQVNDDKNLLELQRALAHVENESSVHKIKKLKMSKRDVTFEYITLEKFKELGNEHLKNVEIVLYNAPQMIIATEKIDEILHNYHVTPLGGHVGISRMLWRIKEKYIWKDMKGKIAKYVKNCEKCKKNKHGLKVKEPMVITTTPNESFEVVSIDTIGPFSRTTQGNRYALTLQDDLTKFVRVIPIIDKEARTLARALVENFILEFGMIKGIKTDMGTEYLNETFKEICSLLKMSHVHSTAYHSQTLGSLERNHKCFNEFTRSYVNENRDDWDQWVKYYSFCYNTTPLFENGYTPFELVFAHKAKLPMDFDTKSIDPIYNIDNYAKELKFRLQKALTTTKEFMKNRKQKTKDYYDQNEKISNFKIGDKVFLQIENRRKLDPVYKGPYLIIHINEPNATIKFEETGKTQIKHKNRLKLYT
jgi:hypothetical protein